MRRHDDVTFEFLNAEIAIECEGSVIMRSDEMVLDIPSQGDTAPVLITGQLSGHVYSGTNISKRPMASHVEARWTNLGEVFVGTWIEEGEEYLFRFRVSAIRSGRAPRMSR